MVSLAVQVHGRCKKNNISGSKHYLTVASGVMMSVFVSPVIAAVTVGKTTTTTWPPSVLLTDSLTSAGSVEISSVSVVRITG